jgi:type III pantothenate kinase
MMKTLALDWGNSEIKLGWFRDDEIQETVFFRERESVLRHIQAKGTPEALVLGPVGTLPDNTLEALEELAPVWQVHPGMEKGISLAYETPETLGADRLAAAVGAFHIFMKKPVLVIDIGTCITYDYISKKGVFEGGSISPGLQMRLKAMGTLTAGLPSVTYHGVSRPPLTGSSTNQSLISGAYHGVRNEIDGFIESYQKRAPDLQVLLTGGDSGLFESALKSSIFAEPHLVLKGLNQMLLMNA